MKLILVVSGFPPRQVGGIETYSYDLAKELRRNGHSSVILCDDDVNLKETGNNPVSIIREEFDGFDVFRLRYNWRSSPGKYWALYSENSYLTTECIKLLKALRPDIVHQTSSINIGTSALRAAHSLGIPSILTMTDSWFICPNASLLHASMQICQGKRSGLECAACFFGKTRTLELINKLPSGGCEKSLKLLGHNPAWTIWNGSLNFATAIEHRYTCLSQALQTVSCVLTPSRFIKGKLEQAKLVRDDRLLYFPHGTRLRADRYGRVRPRGVIRFGFTGRPIREKGITLLLDAFALLRDREAELHVWGHLNQDIIQAYSSLLNRRDSNVFLHKPYGAGEMVSVLEMIDIVVIPSLYPENAPLVVLEAFASGTPVIASNAGGLPELVRDGQGGLLFERGNPQDLATQMLRLMNDPGLYQRLQQRIPDVRSINVEAKELAEIYRQAIKDSTSHIALTAAIEVG